MNSTKSNELVELIHNRLLAVRNLQTIIQLRDFQSLFDSASEELKEKARKLIDAFDFKSLREWYKQRRLDELGTLGVRDLRKIASQLGVFNYNKLPKSILLSEIARKRANGERQCSTADSCSLRRDEGSDNSSRDQGGTLPTTNGDHRAAGCGFDGVTYVAQ